MGREVYDPNGTRKTVPPETVKLPDGVKQRRIFEPDSGVRAEERKK